jgi:putative lipoic acid-binding regulatory protein
MAESKPPVSPVPSTAPAPTPEMSEPKTSDPDTSEPVFVFPCRFPIKAMGLADPGFEALVVEIVSRHAPRPAEADVSARLSRGGKWVSVTLTIQAESRAQLDAIYCDLTAHESVVWVI